MILLMIDNPPQVCLLHKWVKKLWLADHEWVSLMPRDKAALIVEAFDTPNEELFLILGDWMEDKGEPADETQRFRDGNWHDQDYAHATMTLFWRQIQEFRNCPSVKVFIRLLQANWKYDKFLTWYSPAFNHQQNAMYQMMKDTKLFSKLYGEEARKSVKQHHWRNNERLTEEQFKEVCDYAKEVCYYMRAKEDLKEWSELWKDRHFYIQRPRSNWEKAYNPANEYPW